MGKGSNIEENKEKTMVDEVMRRVMEVLPQELEKSLGEAIEKAQKSIGKTIDESQKAVGEAITEAHKTVGEAITEAHKTVGEAVDEAQRLASGKSEYQYLYSKILEKEIEKAVMKTVGNVIAEAKDHKHHERQGSFASLVKSPSKNKVVGVNVVELSADIIHPAIGGGVMASSPSIRHLPLNEHQHLKDVIGNNKDVLEQIKKEVRGKLLDKPTGPQIVKSTFAANREFAKKKQEANQSR